MREVEAWLASHGVDWRCEAQDARSKILAFGDDLALRLVPSPRSLEGCSDPGASARLTNARAARGGEIIHLHEDTWRGRGDIARARLLARLGAASTRRVFARKTRAKTVDKDVARAFLEANHLWRATNAKYAYGLYLEDELVAVATFTKRKLVKRAGAARRTHELLRFCALRDARVVGGISKLVKAFARDRPFDDLVTNIDRDWGGGANWRSLGFETVEIMPPLPMALGADGQRRYLVGRGVGNDGRAALPDALLDDFAASADDPVGKLAAHGLYLVHDAGVERLVLSATPGGHAQELWDAQEPRKAGFYGPTKLPGVAAILDGAARHAPADDDADALASWRNAGPAKDAALVSAAPSSCFENATLEVRERRNGWRTVGLRFPDGRSIYHGIVNRDARLLHAEHLKSAAALALAVLGDRRAPRFLHLGHGAGALPRFLEAVAPDSTHVSVDVDAAVAAAVPGTPRGAVVVGDGVDFVATYDGEPFDCVFIDVFDGDNACPAAFYGAPFLEALPLRPGGALVHNLHLGGATRAAALAAAEAAYDAHFARGCFRAEALGFSAHSGNALLLAATAPLDRARLHEAATAARDRCGLGFDAATRVRRLRRVVVPPER